MDHWDRLALHESERLRVATAALCDSLEDGLSRLRTLEDRLATGDPASALRSMATREQRVGLDSLLNDCVQQRRVWRVTLLRACMERGMSLTEFAMHFGSTRQYAQALAKDARNLSGPGSVGG